MLVVGAESDRRASTAALKAVAHECAGRQGVEVHCWFLRDGDVGLNGWPNPWVLDRLRTWGPARRLDKLRVRRLGDVLRGLRLRCQLMWMRPNVVLLDDGLGERVLRAAPGRPVVVVRRNPGVPAGTRFEPAFAGTPELVLVADGEAEPPGSLRDGGTVVNMPVLLDELSRVPAGASPDCTNVHPALRARLGVLEGEPIVVGWGSDPWIDGHDLFVETLSALDIESGLRVHGVWLGIDAASAQGTAMVDVALRAGLADRLTLLSDDTPALRAGADVVLLPYRVEPDQQMLIETVASGPRVVVFSERPTDHPRWLVRVAGGNPVDAVAPLTFMLTDMDDGWRREFFADHDLAAWCSRFLTDLRRRATTSKVTASAVPSPQV